ncbi:GNAT family N-acetyltransferase [Streptomyces sp. NPDC060194]|uniref:GNAT family N-acetyltransferase n=1 Tax=Streptomyces sp. NPDC060194 TaxID=3347069 RepID=UPI0036672AF1
MNLIVRDFRPADGEATAEVLRAAIPYLLTTPESMAWDTANAPAAQRRRLLVAELDGEVVGRAQIGLAHDSPVPGRSFVNVYVHPDRRGRGAGSLLVRTAEEYLSGLGATTAYSWVLDEPANRAYAERRGYRPGSPAHFLRLGLTGAALPPLAELPPGVELRTVASYADDPRPLFEADAEAVADEPSDVGAELTDHDQWVRHTFGNPLLDRELSTVVVADGEVAAFTFVETDGRTRLSSGGTGTRRAHRGRGLAKLAKNHSLHRARAAGYTEAFTGNDAGNEPMLAINKWFGYEVCATEVRCVREF